jgi:hypothetical protein
MAERSVVLPPRANTSNGDELEILHSVGTVDRRCSHDIHLGLFQFLRPRSLAVSSLSRSSSPLLSRSIDAAIASRRTGLTRTARTGAEQGASRNVLHG